MRAKTYFKKCLRINERIDDLVEESERLRALAERCTASYSSEPRGGGAEADKRLATVAKIIELERKLNREIDRYADMKISIFDIVAELPDERHRDILTMRYSYGLSWGEVARRIHYGKTQTWEMHNAALAAVQPHLDAALAAKKEKNARF